MSLINFPTRPKVRQRPTFVPADGPDYITVPAWSQETVTEPAPVTYAGQPFNLFVSYDTLTYSHVDGGTDVFELQTTVLRLMELDSSGIRAARVFGADGKSHFFADRVGKTLVKVRQWQGDNDDLQHPSATYTVLI